PQPVVALLGAPPQEIFPGAFSPRLARCATAEHTCPQHRACRHDRRFRGPATSFAHLMVPFAAVTTHVAQRVNIRMPLTDPHWRLSGVSVHLPSTPRRANVWT